MIAVDTNLLVYAHRADTDFHEQARLSLTELAEGGVRWSIPWPCVHEFLAIVTHARIFVPPTPVARAVKALEVWMSSPTCETLGEGPGYFKGLNSLVAAGKVTGPRIHDARVAALCIHHGVRELWTADRDFSRFPDLKTVNPLTGRA